MPTINGKAAVAFFKRFDGTVTFGDQRTYEIEETMEFSDHTAGTANYRRRKATVGDFTITITALYKGEEGTADGALLAVGNHGTLEIGPAGTATGKPKGVYPVVVESVGTPIPFDGEVTIDFSFLANGDPIARVQTNVY